METSAADRDWPLTAGQRWLLHVLRESPALARPVQRIYRLRRPLDTANLLAAFEHVVAIHPALRMQAKPVEQFDDDLRRLVDRMSGLMADAVGVGLAANQVGIVRRAAELARAREMIAVAVLHDLNLAALADRVIVMDAGAVVADGAASVALAADVVGRVFGTGLAVTHVGGRTVILPG